ncbi:hypothetical protein Noda2021_09190 [Candidatus Dependentiae bacterium Noda2021]|nr:hypothetical protein Noda2021_09190 [Candidatus Dependentiae bacterium Noda2021]
MRCVIMLLLSMSALTLPQEHTTIFASSLGKKTISTDRCYLRPTQIKEYKEFSHAMSLDDVLCYYLFGGRVSTTRAQRNFASWFNKKSIKLFLMLQNTSKSNPRIWTVLEKQSDEIIGFVGLHRLYKNVNTALSIFNKKNFNLSLSLFPAHQGRHLSLEVTTAFVQAFFNTKKYKRSTGLTFLVNKKNDRAISCFTDYESNHPRYGLQDQGIFKYKYSKRFTMACYTLSRTAYEEFSQTIKDVNVIV